MKGCNTLAMQRNLGPGTPPATPVDAHTPNIIGDRGWIYPRWPLLAAMCIAPFAIVGYLIYLYDESYTCILGIVCRTNLLPGWVEISLIWLAFGLLWLLSLIFGIGQLEGPELHGRISTFVRRISDFEPVRRLLIGYGGVALLGVALAILLGQLTPVAFALATIVIIVAICVYFWHPRTEDEQSAQAQYERQAGQAATPLFVLRSLFPFNRIWPNRAPPVNNNQPPVQPGGWQGNQMPPPTL
jgi:hypothetical protein